MYLGETVHRGSAEPHCNLSRGPCLDIHPKLEHGEYTCMESRRNVYLHERSSRNVQRGKHVVRRIASTVYWIQE